MDIVKIAHLTGHQGSIYTLFYPFDEHYLVSSGGDGWVVKWDINDPDIGQLIAQIDSKVFSLCHIPHSSIIIAGNMDGGIHYMDIENPENNKNIAHHQKGVFNILFIKNHIYTIGGDGIITCWQLSPFKSIESLQLSAKSLRSIQYSALKDEFVIGASDGNIYFLDTDLNIKNIIKQAHQHSVFAVNFTPDGRHLLSGGRDALLKIWDLETHTTIDEIKAHLYTINAIQFNPFDSTEFATASRDKTVKIWHLDNENTPKPHLLKVINTVKNGGHINSVNALQWLNKEFLASAGDDRSILFWHLE